MGKESALHITVLGGGLWGTVLAQHLSQVRPRPNLRLWEFFEEGAKALARTRRHPHIPGFRLDESVAVTSNLDSAVQGAQLLLFVLPSAFLRRTARAASAALGKARPAVINASKGVEPGTLRTMGDILDEELPRASDVFTLSGPSFAREVARGAPTKLILGGPDGSAAQRWRRLFNGGPLSVTLTTDRKGVELGGSLKNALAIGAGILDGLKTGANTKAALLVQGMDEMGSLIAAAGGKRETIYGLSGLGDLILTGTSGESRNRAFGEKIGAGLGAARARREIPTVVEGAEAALSARALARRHKISTPLIDAICGVVHQGRPASAVLKALGFRTI